LTNLHKIISKDQNNSIQIEPLIISEEAKEAEQEGKSQIVKMLEDISSVNLQNTVDGIVKES
jgi:hypothetical protein